MLSLTPLQSWIFILMCTLMLFAIVICIILFIDMLYIPIRNLRNRFLFFVNTKINRNLARKMLKVFKGE